MSIGMYGHLAPVTRVGKVLVRAGHTVLAWVPPQYREAVEGAGARLIGHEPFPDLSGLGFPGLAVGLAAATERCSGKLTEALLAEEIELLVHDVHVPWARVAGDFLGLPRVMTTPLFPAPLATGVTEPVLALSSPYSDKLERSIDAVGRRWGVDLGNWLAVIYNAAPNALCLSTPELTDRELPAGWHYVGPLLDPPPPRRSYGRRPFVYVSFGTHESTEPTKAAVEALAGESLDVLLSTGRTGLSAEKLGHLPSNIEVRSFVSAADVLAGADVFVTHAGSGSVHEALLAGVPMVCVPQAVDQFDWARRITELGAGKRVHADSGAIRTAVREVLENHAYRERAHELGQRLAASGGAAHVVHLAERLVGAPISGK